MIRFSLFIFCILSCSANPEHKEGAVIAPAFQAPPFVGIGYQAWFPPQDWSRSWDEPELGHYDSGDIAIINQHASWLTEAGVDFILVDWSNNIMAGDTNPGLLHIEDATRQLFSQYLLLEHKPKIAVLLGIDGNPLHVANGDLSAKADQVYETLVAPSGYRDLWFEYEERPLLVVYVWTPSPYQNGLPPWDDERFTVRWMTGFMDDQSNLTHEDGRSRYGYWSWWDRSPQTYAVHGGEPEFMVASAAYPGTLGWGSDGTAARLEGETLKTQFKRVRDIAPKIAFVNSWNEWQPQEEVNAEWSNDIEPGSTHGHTYLNLLRSEVTLFKNSWRGNQ